MPMSNDRILEMSGGAIVQVPTTDAAKIAGFVLGGNRILFTDSGASSTLDVIINDPTFVAAPRMTVNKYGVKGYGEEISDLGVGLAADAPATSDSRVNWLMDGDPKWQEYLWRGENGEFKYLYNFKSQKDVAVVSEGGRFGFNARSNDMNYHSRFVGTGLDNADMGGTYTKTKQLMFQVRINSTGTPDKFDYRTSLDNGLTWGSYSTATNILGTAQALESGVTVEFESTTGHTANDYWEFTAFPQLPTATMVVTPGMFDEVLVTSDYTVGSPVYNDRTYDASSSNGQAVTVIPAGTKGALYIGARFKFNDVYFDITTVGTGVTLAVEYWNGASWVNASATDMTSNLTVTGKIYWEKNNLTDWAISTVGDYVMLYYWMRIRSTTNVTVAPTSTTVVPQGGRRFAVYAAHLDYSPAMYVDSSGRVCITDPSIVGAGVVPVDPCCALQIDSTYRGLRLPRMTTTQRDAMLGTAAQKYGLMIYNTTTQRAQVFDQNGGTWRNI